MSTGPTPHSLSRRTALAAGLCLAARPVWSQAERSPIRFGILPIGGTVDSKDVWGPLLDDLSRTLQRPVARTSVTSYDMMEQAIRRDQIDLAFLSGKMALDAVTQRGFVALAQVARHDGLPGYRATLLARRGGPINDINQVLAAPEKWRLARGEKRSLSGFLVPKLELFLPRGIDIETRFQGDIVGTHQRTALAVANNEADLATNNTADFERFVNQFPSEAARLQVLWQSDLIPHGVIVMRRSLDPALRQSVRDFLVSYAKGPGARADQQRGVLKGLHDLAGFLPADNRTLVPVADLARKLDLDSAQAAEWISPAARDARLRRIDADHAAHIRALQAD